MQSGVRRALTSLVLVLAATGVGVIQPVPAQPTNQSRTVQAPDLRESVSFATELPASGTSRR